MLTLSHYPSFCHFSDKTIFYFCFMTKGVSTLNHCVLP
jgi:hypothetical protein